MAKQVLTAEKFYEILSSTGYRWAVSGGELMAKCKVNGEDKCLCPITAVARKITRRYFNPSQYLQAAKAIGLRSREAERIANANDGEAGRVLNKLLSATKLVKTK